MNSTRARRGKPPSGPRGRTYPRSDDLQNALERIRQAARLDRQRRFTSLWHHVYNVDRLRRAYKSLKRRAAPGVDGPTWRQYGEDLEANLRDLSGRLRRGAYHAKPVKRTYIPKPDGRQRPIGVPAVEDKIVQRATVEVLDADIRGFFDATAHEWLVRFVERRIGDPRVVRHIKKWLNAGVLEDGVWRQCVNVCSGRCVRSERNSTGDATSRSP